MSGYKKAQPTREMVAALICERLHKLPSEVKNENYNELMRMWALICEKDRIQAERNNRRS